MVKSPQQCLELTEQEENQLNDLEKKIDGILEANYQGRGFEVEIAYNDIPQLRQLRKPAREELFSRYDIAGWDVKYESTGHIPAWSDSVSSYYAFTAKEEK